MPGLSHLSLNKNLSSPLSLQSQSPQWSAKKKSKFKVVNVQIGTVVIPYL